MMADPGTVPVRTRSAEEIATEIVRTIKETKDSELLARVVEKILDGLEGDAFIQTRHRLETYLKWSFTQ